MFRLITLFLIFYNLSLIVFSQGQEAIESNCPQSEPTSRTLAFGVDRKLVNNELLNAVHLHLLESIKPIDLGIYTFYNGKQIDTELLHQILECGDKYTVGFSVTLDNIEQGVIHIFTREHPPVPSQISLALLKERFVDFAFIYDDVNTYRLNDLSLPSTHITGIKEGQRIDMVTGLSDGYFFTGDDPSIPEAQTYYQILNTDQTFKEFNIYFPNGTDQSDIFSVTCLMDGQQFDAFNSGAVWSGELKVREAVILNGAFSDILESGWHQLRCLVLNNLYGDSEFVSEYINTIAAMYIYVPLKE